MPFAPEVEDLVKAMYLSSWEEEDHRHMAAIGAAFASPEGQAAAGDLPKFATGGVDMLMFDTKAV